MLTARWQTYPQSVWVAVRRRIARLQAIFAFFVFAMVIVTSVLGVFSYTREGANAAAASTLNFQGRLMSATGNLVADGNYNIQFNLYTTATGGTTQWTETRLVSATQGVAVKNGYFSVALGDVSSGGTAFPGTVNWDQEQWLGMTVRGSGSCAFAACTPADAEMTPRFKLTAVPYAFRAGKLADSTNTNAYTADDLIQKAPTTPQVVNTALAAIRLNQTSSGGLLQLQKSGTDVFGVDNNGNLTTQGLTAAGATNLNGNAVLGDSTTDRLTINSQILGTSALVFQGAVDNANTTTFSITEPTAPRTITVPDASGTLAFTNLAQTISGLQTFNSGITLAAGQTITINGDGLTDLTGTGLTNNTGALSVVYGSTAGTAAQGNVTLNCPSGTGNLSGGGTAITLGAGGTCAALNTVANPAFSTSVTTPIITSTAGLTLNSGNNIITIDSTDTTIQKSAAGNTTIDLTNAAATTLVLDNSGAGAASLNLNDGALLTAGTSRLTNTGALQNITGLTITSGGSAVTGNSSFANNLNLNGDVFIGDATTDRLTINSQILGANPLAFQGATDNAFTTTFAITDPTANRTITVPNESGTILLLGPAAAQVDSSTNSSVFINKTGASGNILQLQKSGTNVLSVANDGSTTVSSTSTSAFLVQTGGGTPSQIFDIDSSGNIITIGPATGDTTGVVLRLDVKTNTGDPTGTDGSMYYNSFYAKFRCFENGTWTDCVSNTKTVRKLANTTRTSNTTLAADPDLTFATNANTTYYIKCTVFYDTAAAPDFKFSSTNSTTATVSRTVYNYLAPASTTYVNALNTTVTGLPSTAIAAGTGSGEVIIEATVTNGATTPTSAWSFNWAQNTSNAANTTVLAGSTCSYSTR